MHRRVTVNAHQRPRSRCTAPRRASSNDTGLRYRLLQPKKSQKEEGGIEPKWNFRRVATVHRVRNEVKLYHLNGMKRP